MSVQPKIRNINSINIIFYIKRQQNLNDKFVLYAYDVENEIEVAVTSDLEGIQHLAISSDGKKIAGYGAAAKASTLLSYCGIKSDTLDYIADKNPLKQVIKIILPKASLIKNFKYGGTIAVNVKSKDIY